MSDALDALLEAVVQRTIERTIERLLPHLVRGADDYVSVDAAAAELGVPVRALKKDLKSRGVKIKYLAKKWFVLRSDLVGAELPKTKASNTSPANDIERDNDSRAEDRAALRAARVRASR